MNAESSTHAQKTKNVKTLSDLLDAYAKKDSKSMEQAVPVRIDNKYIHVLFIFKFFFLFSQG